MTYLELEFPDAEAARAATGRLEEMEITGEWFMRKSHMGDTWRLSIASEVALRQDHIARLGGKVLEDAAGSAVASSDDEA
jgi:hypothetical protein